jgi:hypothetical protein
VNTADHVGVVQPQYRLARRLLFPIYGRDQLIFFAVFAVLVALGATINPELALYMGVGGYVGAVIMMEISTPSSLLLPADCEKRVVRFLDDAPLLKPTGNGDEWISSTGRMYRWDSDTIRLKRITKGVLVTGRHYDLQLIADELAA